MKIITDLTLLKKERQPIMLAAGFFDGMHRGHRKVVEEAIGRARKAGGNAWVLTFDTHPVKILKHASTPLMLTSTRHKLRLLGQLGIDGCLLMPFTPELANLEPEAFINKLRNSAPALVEIFVGRNWRFGRGRKGDSILLLRLASELNLKVTMIRPVLRRGKIVSSTRIRSEVMRGNLEEAATMLGRPFSIFGTVTRGRTVGRKLGFPTANLNPHNEVLPPPGVYAVYALLKNRVFNGVFNLGNRPTFKKKGENSISLELHILSLNRDLYGEDIEVFFVKKLRDEKRFFSKEDLKTQIAHDVERARKLLDRKISKFPDPRRKTIEMV